VYHTCTNAANAAAEDELIKEEYSREMGQKSKTCRREGCTTNNIVQKGRFYIRHRLKFKRCRMKDARTMQQ
jgi:hypothetical protein